MQKQPLTRTQRKYYDAIVSLNDAAGYFPTTREIAGVQGQTSIDPARQALHHLEQKGWIARTGENPRAARAYRIVGQPVTDVAPEYLFLPDTAIHGQDRCLEIDVSRPLFAGKDHAGKPIRPLSRQFIRGQRVVGYWTPAHLLEQKP
jgi:SOS-response transcriptional repressor LexA